MNVSYHFLESCEGAAVVSELGAALVSILELSEAGEVVGPDEEEEGAVVSFLLDSCGADAPEEASR